MNLPLFRDSLRSGLRIIRKRTDRQPDQEEPAFFTADLRDARIQSAHQPDPFVHIFNANPQKICRTVFRQLCPDLLQTFRTRTGSVIPDCELAHSIPE